MNNLVSATIIALEGIDGSGKGTQSRILTDALTAAGKKASLLSFPRYSDTRFGGAIGDFLNGRFGNLETVSPYLVSVLYAGDRFESKAVIEQAVSENDVLIFDRYTASNIAHQGAKVGPEERDEIVSWIEDIEHSVFGLPHPDMTLLLEVSVETSQALIQKKAPRDYTDEKADLQESDVAYMAAVRDCYLTLAERSDWRTVSCARDGELRTVEEIAAEVWTIAQDVTTPT